MRVDVSRSATFEENVIDTVDVDEDSDADEEVQTVPASEVKSISVSAQPSDDSGAADDATSQESNDSSVVISEPNATQQEPVLRRSSRKFQPPRPFWVAPSDTANLAIVSCNAATEKCFVSTDVPQNCEEATSPGNVDFWMPAIDKEESSTERNKTWDLVRRTPDMNVLPRIYIFTLKDPGSKARIVAKGCRQLHGVDYGESNAIVTSSCTGCMSSLRSCTLTLIKISIWRCLLASTIRRVLILCANCGRHCTA